MAFTTAILAVVSSTTLMSCAEKLPRKLTDKAPQGLSLEQKLDLSAINFYDFPTEQSTSVLDYMNAEGKDYLLLTFGSDSCGACNAEAGELTTSVIGKHPLYLTESGKHFEIIGVNTDKKSALELRNHLKRFPYIRWSDPAGLTMLSSFMPVGHKFSVPLAVMINRDGIIWRVMPDEPLDVNALIARVEKTLGLDASGEIPGGGKKPPVPTTIPTSDLTYVAPGRLNGLKINACDGKKTTFGSSLGSAIADDGLRVVQVVKGMCDAACQNNLAELKRFEAACTALTENDSDTATTKTCQVASLHSGASANGPEPSLCNSETSPRIFGGGEEFFTTFKTFFNWTYIPFEDPETWELNLPAVTGPLVMAFDAKGRLVFAQEGQVVTGALAAVLKAKTPRPVAVGPDFPIYGHAPGSRNNTLSTFSMAQWRTQTRYTILAAWGAYPIPCGSCIAELKHWSEPNQLLDFCNNNPSECQVAALEASAPAEGQTLAQLYNGLINGDGQSFDGLVANGIRVPLILDPAPKYNDNGDANPHRIFNAYLRALYPEWTSEYRTVIYDREGKIVAAFKAVPPEEGGPDPVLSTVKNLLKNK